MKNELTKRIRNVLVDPNPPLWHQEVSIAPTPAISTTKTNLA
jgi:hypothetical protein